ncbi:KAP family P-loop NTPase fold protein [Kordiimonas sp.]|uniref:KAP family P-loop NTPase fold protein n=1 Tax=Kordiimonas sp. TaxID=1970157 RepID=UPI003A90DD75
MLNKYEAELIDKDDPWARDKLKRQAVAQYLTPLIASVRQPFVISLHSPYGTGKSFFFECWKADLENQGYKVVLFDAWKTDFSDDPLSAFISSIKKQLSNGDSKTEKKFDELARRTGGFLRSKFLPLVLKSASRKLIGDEGIEEFLEDIGANPDEVSDMLGSVALEALATQEMAEDSMRDFREFLSETVNEIVADAKSEDHQKLIILVDELDRCKPSYAIEVLESIKHLFAVQGTVFVLAFDETQIRETIAQSYGLHTSGEGYLRKFIDWQFKLPEPEVKRYGLFLGERLFADTQSEAKKSTQADYLRDGVSLIAETHNMTCRQLEHALLHANIVFRTHPDLDNIHLLVVGIVTALYVIDRERAHAVVENFQEALALRDKLEKGITEDSTKARFGTAISAGLILAYFMTEDIYQAMKVGDEFEKQDKILQAYETDRILKLYRELSMEFYRAQDSLASICLGYVSGVEKVHALARKM